MAPPQVPQVCGCSTCSERCGRRIRPVSRATMTAPAPWRPQKPVSSSALPWSWSLMAGRLWLLSIREGARLDATNPLDEALLVAAVEGVIERLDLGLVLRREALEVGHDDRVEILLVPLVVFLV